MNGRVWRRTTAAVLLVWAAGCAEPGSLPGLGLDLQVRVEEAQLLRGPLGRDEGGPSVSQVLRQQPEVMRGEAGVSLAGRLGPEGVALHVHAVGDEDHWVVQPDGFDFVVTDELLWSAALEFSPAIASDRVEMHLQAVDAQGRRGPVQDTSFSILPELPAAQLLVSLGWDAPVDLDLHVMQPDGLIIGAKNGTSLQPAAGEVLPPDAWMDGGVFWFDSNQQCRLDLRNRETVSWTKAASPGTYRVFAHLFSPCNAESVNFSVLVQHEGGSIAEANSTQYAFDSRVHPPASDAPGLLVLEVEVP